MSTEARIRALEAAEHRRAPPEENAETIRARLEARLKGIHERLQGYGPLPDAEEARRWVAEYLADLRRRKR